MNNQKSSTDHQRIVGLPVFLVVFPIIFSGIRRLFESFTLF
ncbi:hypothetical protein [Lentilactobacillus farraginis]|nr:hypothetical protein [Lentilactobacillus farraginis]